MAFYRGPRIVTNGLVLALDAANPKSYAYGSTLWNDLSGNLNSGSLNNAPALNNDAFGSLVFNGLNTYVDTPTGSATMALTSAGSLSCWFKTTMTTQGELVRQIGSSDNGLEIQITAGKINGAVFLGSWQNIPASSLSYNDNIWHNVVMTVSGTLVNVYVDSNSIYSNNLGSGTLNTGNAKIRIGLHPNGTAAPFSGSISNVQVYNRALSAAEVAQNYNAISSRFQYPLTTISTYLTLTQAAGLSIYDDTIENTTYLTRYSSYASASAFALVNEPVI